MEAYAHNEKVKSEHGSATVSDNTLTKERLVLQKDIRGGCLARLDRLIIQVEQTDFSDFEEQALGELLSELSHDKIFDYRDQFTTQTYEALWQKIHDFKIVLEEKGIFYDERVRNKVDDLSGKLEKNRLRVVYIFDPITLRTQIFDDFRNKKKQLRESAANPEEIQALKDKTREKLILSIELLAHLQLSFSKAYQELFPRLAEQIEAEASAENPYPKLDILDVIQSLETGLVDYGVTTNIHRNNIVDHLELLTDGHNHISKYLESFAQPLDGKEFFRIYTEYYLGKRIEPTGEINLILNLPYRDLTFECETDEDYFIFYSGEENSDQNQSYGVNFSSRSIPNGSGKIVDLPISFIRGLAEFRFTRHEDAHSLQSQYLRSGEGQDKSVEAIAANREKWVSVFDISYEVGQSTNIDQADWRKRSQVHLAGFLNQAIIEARGEIQAYVRDGTDVEAIADFLTKTGEDALYDYLNTDVIFNWLEKKLSQVSGFDAALIKQDIMEAQAVYSKFLRDALEVVENYLRLLGGSRDVRETASIMIRFTTLNELKWLVTLLKERSPEALTYDPSEKVVEILAEIDGSLSYDFVKVLTKWGSEITKIRDLGFDKKGFDYIIGHMRWNNFHSEGASVKALSNPESLLIFDKPSTTLRLQSQDQLVALCKLLGLIGPNQKLDDLVKKLDSNESVNEGYHYRGEVIHNVPTNIKGMSLTTSLEASRDGTVDVTLNFDLETFHLMLNQAGFHC